MHIYDIIVIKDLIMSCALRGCVFTFTSSHSHSQFSPSPSFSCLLFPATLCVSQTSVNSEKQSFD